MLYTTYTVRSIQWCISPKLYIVVIQSRHIYGSLKHIAIWLRWQSKSVNLPLTFGFLWANIEVTLGCALFKHFYNREGNECNFGRWNLTNGVYGMMCRQRCWHHNRRTRPFGCQCRKPHSKRHFSFWHFYLLNSKYIFTEQLLIKFARQKLTSGEILTLEGTSKYAESNILYFLKKEKKIQL